MKNYNRRQIGVSIRMLAILLMLAFGGYGQDKYSIGVKGGLNYANIGSDAENLDPRVGYHFGIYGDGTINDLFKFGTDLQYSGQGAQNKDTERTCKFDYLTLAFLFKLTPANQSRFNVHVGPQFGYLLNAKIDNEDVKDEMNMADLSLVGGLGYNLTSRLGVVARYSYGITSTADRNDEKRYPNRVIQFGLVFALTNGQNKATND